MRIPCTALFVLLAAWAAAFAAQDPSPEDRRPVVVFLVRHAETAADTRTSSDPDLSEAGSSRAAALARLLGHVGATHLYSSEYQRTQATLAPLAEAVGHEVEVVPAGKSRSQVEALRALPAGAVAVVAGHSNTVPQLVRLLGGELEGLGPNGAMDHGSYDRVIQVILSPGEGAGVHTLDLRYGEGSGAR